MDTSLLYLISDPTDPVVVWGKVAGHFEKKCGKMNEKSLGGVEYFLTFLDDK